MDAAKEFSPKVLAEILEMKTDSAARFFTFFAVAAVIALAFFAQSQNSPELLQFAFSCAFVAVIFLWIQNFRAAKFGVPVFFSSLIFAPWLAFLFAETLFASAFPLRAEFTFALNLIPFFVLFVAEQQSRTEKFQSKILGLVLVGIIAAFCAEILEFFVDENFAGTPSSAAGICTFFVSGALILNRKISTKIRALCLYAAISAGTAIFCFRDFSAWIALCAGTAILAFFVVRSTNRRILAVAAAICAGAISPIFIEPDVPVLKKIAPEVEAEAALEKEKSEAWLPKIALEILSENKIFGAGTGTFPENFQQRVPDKNWQIRPENSSSFYLTILAENGILGAILLFVPAAWIFLKTAKNCAQTSVSPRQKLPERRTNLASALGIFTAFAIYFALSFPPQSVGIFCVLAVFAGIALRENRAEKFVKILSCPSKKSQNRGIAISILVPAAAACLLFPSVLATAEFSAGTTKIRGAFEDIFSEKIDTPNFDDFDKIAAAKTHFLRAVSLKKNDADSWNFLAKIYAAEANFRPNEAEKFSKLFGNAAENSLKNVPNFVPALVSKAASQNVLGDSAGALETLKIAENCAGKNAPVLFRIAEIHRRISPESEDAMRIFKWLNSAFPKSARIEQERALTELFRSESKQKHASPSDEGIFEI